MSGAPLARRIVVATAVLVLIAVGTGAALLGTAGAGGSATGRGVVGPGRVTVRIDVDHSRFAVDRIGVRPHTAVRFVVVNHDPIGHELIVGGPEVHARHAGGHETHHPPRSGEVSVPADGRATTTYVFHAPGPVEYACHLPGHYEHGMHGIVDVVGVVDEPTR